MNRRILLSMSAAMIVAANLQPSFAASPMAGEVLSENQTFTYRLLDQFPTLDPQLNEETAGSHVLQ